MRRGLHWWILKKTGWSLSLELIQCCVCTLAFSISSCLPLKWTRGIPPLSRLWSSLAATPSAKWRWKLETWSGPRWCGLLISITTTALCRPSWNWRTSTSSASLGGGRGLMRLNTRCWLWLQGLGEAAHPRGRDVLPSSSVMMGGRKGEHQFPRVLTKVLLKSLPVEPSGVHGNSSAASLGRGSWVTKWALASHPPVNRAVLFLCKTRLGK